MHIFLPQGTEWEKTNVGWLDGGIERGWCSVDYPYKAI